MSWASEQYDWCCGSWHGISADSIKTMIARAVPASSKRAVLAAFSTTWFLPMLPCAYHARFVEHVLDRLNIGCSSGEVVCRIEYDPSASPGQPRYKQHQKVSRYGRFVVSLTCPCRSFLAQNHCDSKLFVRPTMYSLLLLGLGAVHSANAWGDLGHETIAYIAQNFVKSSTETWAQNVLSDTSSSYLANVATWADTYKYTDEGAFSEPYHFIDAEDSPPSTCNVNYDRDCGDTGCSVSAIANYTQRVQEPDSLSAEQVNYALRFIVHFVGDITQPLHDEAYEYGANDVDVTFDGTSTNLHHIWDTNMPEQLRGGYSLSDAKIWADNLTEEINSGSYESEKASWISGLDISDAKTTAMSWATDANKYVCSIVMPNGAKPLESGDLYPTYYNGAIDTVELQIAKAGYRLAAWLDAIAATQSNSTRRALPGRRVHLDLSGRDLLPAKREVKSLAKLKREARGYGCKH